MTRAEIQSKIDELRKGKTITVVVLTPLMSKWFKTQKLAQDNLTQGFMEQHLLDDLINYEGVVS